MESKRRIELIEVGVKILAVLGAGVWALFLFVAIPRGRTDFIELGLKVVAVAAAGIWAVFLLIVLRKRELAEADLRKRDAEIQLAQADSLKKEADIRDQEFKAKLATMELELKKTQADSQIREAEIRMRSQILDLDVKEKGQTVVAVDIKTAVYRGLDGCGYIILAVVDLANRGTRNTRIKWENEPPAFSVRFTKFAADGKADHDQPVPFRVMQTRNPAAEAISHVVRAGTTEAIPFLIRVSLPGIYLLSFRGAVDPQAVREAAVLEVALPTAWTANKYVFVGDTPVLSPVATKAEPAVA